MSTKLSIWRRKAAVSLASLALGAGIAFGQPVRADDDMMGGGMPQNSTPMESMPDDKDPPMDAMGSQMTPTKPIKGTVSGDTAATDVPAAALPGFSEAPGLYHMGATGFFLDHPEHITLTPQQRNSLEAIKNDANTQRNGYRQRIEQAESAVWSLTGAAQPDSAAIEAKIREVEALRVEERLAYIRAVGQAAGVLTPSQRKQLAGLAAPSTARAAPASKPTISR